MTSILPFALRFHPRLPSFSPGHDDGGAGAGGIGGAGGGVRGGGGGGVYRDRWFLFNDAEVKPFDPHQIPAECFGGELTSKTYDQLTDKFMDFSFEKTNSAYMLFYERISAIKEDDDKARDIKLGT